MHTADVDLTEHGSRYYCPNGCGPATLLLHVEAHGARWDVVAPHGYALAIKPTANPGRSTTGGSPAEDRPGDHPEHEQPTRPPRDEE